MQVLGRENPDIARLPERLCLPVGKSSQSRLGQTEAAEEAYPVTSGDATRGIHADSSRLCVKNRRQRCSTATAARIRIVCLSPGKSSFSVAPPFSPLTCT